MKTSVEIDDELGRRIERLADMCQQPTERFIREAIEQHARRLEARASFFDEADASWDAYRKDGIHLTGDQLSAWLKSVGTDDEMPPPECRR